MNLTFEELPTKIHELSEKVDLLLDAVSTIHQPEESDSWMTLEALTEYLGEPGKPLPKSTVYGWVQKDTIPHSKKGKRLYFSKKSTDLWLREGR